MSKMHFPTAFSAVLALSVAGTTALAQSQLHEAERADCNYKGGTYHWESNYCELPSDRNTSAPDSGCGFFCAVGGALALVIIGEILSSD